MKKFLTRVILFSLLQGLGLLFFLGNPLPGEKNYLARTIDKHERLRSTRSPRLILVGGSNVAFGFVSDELSARLKMPVVNMGLVGSLGLEFMLNEVRDQVRPGDLVVLSPEYQFGSSGRDPQTIRQLLEVRPESARFLALRDWKDGLADTGLNWIGGYLRRAILKIGAGEEPPQDDYRREGFDEANSYVGHYGMPSLTRIASGQEPVRTMVHPLEPRVFKMLQEFADHCAKAGAQCFFSWPPQPPDFLQTEISSVKEIGRKLESVKNLKILDSPEEQIYPPEQFYDTLYHLTREGALRRSRFLAERLIGFL